MQTGVDDRLHLVRRQLATGRDRLDDLPVVVVQNRFHLFAEGGTHFGAAVRFGGRFELTDAQHLWLNREHVEQVLVERDLRPQTGQHEHPRLGQHDLIAGGGDQIALRVGTLHPRIDLASLGPHLLDADSQFVELRPTDRRVADVQDDGIQALIARRLVQPL